MPLCAHRGLRGGVKYSNAVIQAAHVCAWLKWRKRGRAHLLPPPCLCVWSPIMVQSLRSSLHPTFIRVVVTSTSRRARTSPMSSRPLRRLSHSAVGKRLHHCVSIDSGCMSHTDIKLIKKIVFKTFHVSSSWLKAQNPNQLFWKFLENTVQCTSQT